MIQGNVDACFRAALLYMKILGDRKSKTHAKILKILPAASPRVVIGLHFPHQLTSGIPQFAESAYYSLAMTHHFCKLVEREI